jgi:hypothetical protein
MGDECSSQRAVADGAALVDAAVRQAWNREQAEA